MTAADLSHDDPSTGTATSTDWSSSETYSEMQEFEESSDGEFADVSEWTHSQVGVERTNALCGAIQQYRPRS